MDLSSFSSFISNVKGRSVSVIDSLKQLSMSLIAGHDIGQGIQSISTYLVGCIKFPDLTRIDDSIGIMHMTCNLARDEFLEMVNFLNSLKANDEECVITAPGFSVRLNLLSSETSEGSEAVSIQLEDSVTSEAIATWNMVRDSAHALVSEIDASRGKLQSLVNGISDAIRGFALSEQLSDLCQTAAGVFAANRDSFISIMTSRIEEYSAFTADMKQAAISALAGGPSAVLSYVQSFISRMNDIASNEDPTVNYFQSTDISFNTYASGFIASAIGNVLTAVGAVVTALNALLGMAITFLGTLATWGAKIAAVAATRYEDTRFGFNCDYDTANAFSFVISQSTVTDPIMASLVRSAGYRSFHFLVKQTACVVCGYLVNPDDPTSSEIGYEIHLSTDFDLFDYVSSEGPNTLMFKMGTARDYFKALGMNDSYVVVNNHKDPRFANKFLPLTIGNVNNNVGRLCLPYVFCEGGVNREHLMGLDELVNLSYNPLDVSLIGAIKDFFTDEKQVAMYRRLCTGLLILFKNVFDEFDVDSSEGPCVFPVFTDAGTEPLVTINLRYMLMYCLCPCYSVDFSSIGWTPQSPLDPIQFNHNNFDALITRISAVFNQCKYVSDTPEDVYDWHMKILQWHVDTETVTLANYSVHDTFPTRVIKTGFSPVGPVGAWYPTADKSTLVSGWPTAFSTTLPTLTFSGWMSGLIVDGAIAVGTAMLIAGASIGVWKLRNKQAQLQAVAEDKWYSYSENYDPANPAENKANWKAYKRARLKNNILSLFTGNGALSLGLYDDSEQESLVSRLTGFVSDKTAGDDAEATAAESTNLDTIITLIRGPFEPQNN